MPALAQATQAALELVAREEGHAGLSTDAWLAIALSTSFGIPIVVVALIFCCLFRGWGLFDCIGTSIRCCIGCCIGTCVFPFKFCIDKREEREDARTQARARQEAAVADLAAMRGDYLSVAERGEYAGAGAGACDGAETPMMLKEPFSPVRHEIVVVAPQKVAEMGASSVVAVAPAAASESAPVPSAPAPAASSAA